MNGFLCGHTTGVSCGSGQRDHNDFVTDSEKVAKAHVAEFQGNWDTAGWYREIEFRADGSCPLVIVETEEEAQRLPSVVPHALWFVRPRGLIHLKGIPFFQRPVFLTLRAHLNAAPEDRQVLLNVAATTF